MKIKLALFIFTFTGLTFAQTNPPSSIYLEEKVVQDEIPYLKSSIERTNDICKINETAVQEICELRKIRVKEEIKSLYSNNCNREQQGGAVAASDCVSYITRRFSRETPTAFKSYLPTKVELARLTKVDLDIAISKKVSPLSGSLSVNNNKNKESVFESLDRTRESRFSGLASAGANLSVEYTEVYKPQGQKFLQNFWEPKEVKVSEYNEQDAAFIYLFRAHVRKQTKDYLNWCMKRDQGINLEADFSIDGLSQMVSHCEGIVSRDARICSKYKDSRVMPGCESYIELKNSGRNIATIQESLYQKNILKGSRNEAQ